MLENTGPDMDVFPTMEFNNSNRHGGLSLLSLRGSRGVLSRNQGSKYRDVEAPTDSHASKAGSAVDGNDFLQRTSESA